MKATNMAPDSGRATATKPPPERRNWPHLLLLMALPAYALLSEQARWTAPVTLAGGTLLALAWLMLCERWWPAREAWQASPAEMRRDAGSLGLAALVDTGFSLAANTATLAWQEARMGTGMGACAHALQSFWEALPWLIALPLVIALGEFLPYWLHRWAHEKPALWRWHALHHWPTTLNASNSVLVHPFNLLWNKLGRFLPWLLLEVPPTLMLWAALFIQVQELAAHANVAGSLGRLRWVFGGAELHRWHHSERMSEALNYGTVVPWWDKVFGSWVRPDAGGPERLGWAQGSWRPERLRGCDLLCGPVTSEPAPRDSAERR